MSPPQTFTLCLLSLLGEDQAGGAPVGLAVRRLRWCSDSDKVEGWRRWRAATVTLSTGSDNTPPTILEREMAKRERNRRGRSRRRWSSTIVCGGGRGGDGGELFDKFLRQIFRYGQV
ncbi:hypothetical protein HanIR_Chr14g0690451 [Helianthus annuus]|nr:hypothetical protein HanIR_Chr14g0690451 [Helianthus annuus]